MTTTPITALSPQPAAPAHPGAPNAGGDDSAFARELARAGQGEGGAAPPAEGAAPRGAKGAEAKPRARSAQTDAKPAAKDIPAEPAAPEIVAAEAAPKAADEEATPAEPSALPLPAMLAALLNPTPPRAQAAAVAAEGDAAAAALSGDRRPAPGGEGTQAGAADAQGAPNGADALPVFTLPQAAAPAAPSANAASAGGAPTDMHEARVPAPLGSPEFAPALGAQVSLLVKDGLQEARLQISPPEMGPITVQIQIDGSNARVTLAAEQAPTRDALEQALPALAGALRDEGLTLTGGGVFEQQPRQPRGDGDEGNTRATPHGGGADSGAESADALPARAAPRAAALRGGVDVYA
jgi:flagellar hook-length control protein FliK